MPMLCEHSSGQFQGGNRKAPCFHVQHNGAQHFPPSSESQTVPGCSTTTGDNQLCSEVTQCWKQSKCPWWSTQSVQVGECLWLVGSWGNIFIIRWTGNKICQHGGHRFIVLLESRQTPVIYYHLQTYRKPKSARKPIGLDPETGLSQ